MYDKYETSFISNKIRRIKKIQLYNFKVKIQTNKHYKMYLVNKNKFNQQQIK